MYRWIRRHAIEIGRAMMVAVISTISCVYVLERLPACSVPDRDIRSPPSGFVRTENIRYQKQIYDIRESRNVA